MDNETKRRALGRFPSGIYVVTSRHGGDYGAATITWAMQTSFTPVLIATALGRKSNVFRCLEQSRVAVLHVAGYRQLELARRFACPTVAADGRINGEAFVEGANTAPVVPAFPAHFECEVEQIVDTTGDHTLVILRAVSVECRSTFRPMTLPELRAYLDRVPLPAKRPPEAEPVLVRLCPPAVIAPRGSRPSAP